MKCQKLVKCKKKKKKKRPFKGPISKNSQLVIYWHFGMSGDPTYNPKVLVFNSWETQSICIWGVGNESEKSTVLQIGPSQFYYFMTTEQMLSAGEELVIRLQYGGPDVKTQ